MTTPAANSGATKRTSRSLSAGGFSTTFTSPSSAGGGIPWTFPSTWGGNSGKANGIKTHPSRATPPPQSRKSPRTTPMKPIPVPDFFGVRRFDDGLSSSSSSSITGRLRTGFSSGSFSFVGRAEDFTFGIATGFAAGAGRAAILSIAFVVGVGAVGAALTDRGAGGLACGGLGRGLGTGAGGGAAGPATRNTWPHFGHLIPLPAGGSAASRNSVAHDGHFTWVAAIRHTS